MSFALDYCLQLSRAHRLRNAVSPRMESMDNFDEIIYVPGLANVKLSDLTWAGWLLILLCLPVMVLIGFELAGPAADVTDALRDSPRLVQRTALVGITLFPTLLVGILLFFAGKWLFETKLKIIVFWKRSKSGNS